MSVDTKDKDIYISSNGEILRGNRARLAMVEADIRQLREELPPPTISLTLRQPNTNSEPHLDSTLHDSSSSITNYPTSNEEQNRDRIPANQVEQESLEQCSEEASDSNTTASTAVEHQCEHDTLQQGTDEATISLEPKTNAVPCQSEREASQEGPGEVTSHLQYVLQDLDGSSLQESTELDHYGENSPNLHEQLLLHDDDHNQVYVEDEPQIGLVSTSDENESIGQADSDSLLDSQDSGTSSDDDSYAELPKTIGNDTSQQGTENNQFYSHIRRREVCTSRGNATARAAVIPMDSKVDEGAIKAKDIKIQASALAAITGIDAKAVTANIAGQKLETSTNANVQVTGVEIKVMAAEMSGVKAKVSASAGASARGASLKVASSSTCALNIEAKVSAEADVGGISCDAVNTDVNLAKGGLKSSVSASTNVAKVQAGGATATGAEVGVMANASASARATDIAAGKVDIQGAKVGASARATAEATGLDVKAGTAKISGAEITATASASASAGFELKVANANISGFDGFGAHASVKAKGGIKALNINAGASGKTGITASATFEFGNVVLKPGLPGLHFAPALNLGFGGGVGGREDDSGGGRGRGGGEGGGGEQGSGQAGGGDGGSGEGGGGEGGGGGGGGGEGGEEGGGGVGGRGGGSGGGGIEGGYGGREIGGGGEGGISGAGAKGREVLIGGQGRRGTTGGNGEEEEGREGDGRGGGGGRRNNGGGRNVKYGRGGSRGRVAIGAVRAGEGCRDNTRRWSRYGGNSNRGIRHGGHGSEGNHGGSNNAEGHSFDENNKFSSCRRGTHVDRQNQSDNGRGCDNGGRGGEGHSYGQQTILQGKHENYSHGNLRQRGHKHKFYQDKVERKLTGKQEGSCSESKTVLTVKSESSREKSGKAEAQKDVDHDKDTFKTKLNSASIKKLPFEADAGRGTSLGLSTAPSKRNFTTKSEILIDVTESSVKEDNPLHFKMLDVINSKHQKSTLSKQPVLDDKNKSGEMNVSHVAKMPTDGELLTARASEVYAPMFRELRKYNPPSDGKKQPKNIPESRAEALKEVRKKIGSVKEQLASARSRHSRDYHSSKSQSSSYKSENEDVHDQEDCSKPKQKETPFGANKNIHTLGCYQNESSKQLKSLGGRKVGFKD